MTERVIIFIVTASLITAVTLILGIASLIQIRYRAKECEYTMRMAALLKEMGEKGYLENGEETRQTESI